MATPRSSDAANSWGKQPGIYLLPERTAHCHSEAMPIFILDQRTSTDQGAPSRLTTGAINLAKPQQAARRTGATRAAREHAN